MLAGCTGDAGGGVSGGDGEPWALPGHPALAGLDGQPVISPEPGEAPALVVGFEDPSCISCQRSEQGPLQKLQSDHVAAGELTFVYRGLPITYPWGRPATQALESTDAAVREAGAGRDAPAFWGLKDHYYAEREAFSVDNVHERTEAYLASETDRDAAAVVEAAREKRHDDQVSVDTDAAERADAVATPTFFLFREGEFRTTITGAQSYDVFASALEL